MDEKNKLESKEFQNSQEKSPAGKAYNFEDFTILVVEDSAFISDLLSSCLVEMGVGKVYKSSSVKSAKNKILSFNTMVAPNNIDMVVLDWLMPEENGSELLKWMRTHESPGIRFCSVIVCSAYTSADLVTESRDLGANEILVKPLSAEKLMKRMLHIIDHPRSFIQSPAFTGPDRRRRNIPYESIDRREINAEVVNEV